MHRWIVNCWIVCHKIAQSRQQAKSIKVVLSLFPKCFLDLGKSWKVEVAEKQKVVWKITNK